MPSTITIRVYPYEIQIRSSADSMPRTIPLERENAESLKKYSGQISRELAVLSDKYDECRLEARDRTYICSALAELGQKSARILLDGRANEFIDILKKYHESDLRVIGLGRHDPIWIPWELICFRALQAYSGFSELCKLKKNIYRVHASSRGIQIEVPPTLGFLSHQRIPYQLEEFELFGKLDESGRAKRQPSVNFVRASRGQTELLRTLESSSIIHLSGLVTPLRYVGESMILIDRNFMICLDDFRHTRGKRKQFEFKGTPLVVFNVRDNYARNPFHIRDYIYELWDRGAPAIIASELPVPSSLTLEFTRVFYDRLFEEASESIHKEQIERALTYTKEYIAEEFNNPFAVFYAPYFQPSKERMREPRRVCDQMELAQLIDRYTEGRHINLVLLGLHKRVRSNLFVGDSLEGMEKMDKILEIIKELKPIEKTCALCETIRELSINQEYAGRSQQISVLVEKIDGLCEYI